MNLAAYIRYLWLMQRTRPRRYRALFETINQTACRRIVEIGVYNGRHAVQMIQTASVHHSLPDIYYFGFDLFEDLSEDLLRKEGSKKPPPYSVVQHKLEKTGANIRLFKGDTKITLPRFISGIGEVDFIFIDGGHSVETIRSDWNHVKELMGKDTVAIFDDYYVNENPEIAGLGCQAIVDHLDQDLFDVNLLEPTDVFTKEWGELKIKMVVVKRNSSM